MLIASYNVNGLRSALKKGFREWLEESDIDILCLQELRAEEKELPEDIRNPKNYFCYFHPSQSRKGHSGTAIFTKIKPESIELQSGHHLFDKESRIMKINYNNFQIFNLYIPQGGRNKERLDYKLEALNNLIDQLPSGSSENIILAGDFNIAHEEIDLARPKENQHNICFTKEERLVLDKLIDKGYLDSFRIKNPTLKEQYTWWSARGNCREKNIGWRVDYIFISQKMASCLEASMINKNVCHSDHCPTSIKINI